VRHDLVVDVEKAQLVRDQSPDLLATRAGGVRDAYDGAVHVTRR
jgi:hypothetical protein